MRKSTLIVFLFFLAFALRFEKEFFNPMIYTDQQRYIVTVQKIIEGQGVSLSYADTADLSKSIAKPYPAAAEGYSFLLVPFWLLTHSAFYTIVLPNLLALLLFFFVVFRFWQSARNEFDEQVAIAFLILLAFGNAPWHFYGSTDLIALCLFTAASWFLFRLADGRRPVQAALLSAFLLFTTFYLRFAYLPLLVVLPVFLLTRGLWTGNKSLIKNTLMLIVVLILLVAGSWLIRSHASDYLVNAGEKTIQARSFFPENLALFNVSMPIDAFTDSRVLFSLFNRVGIAKVVFPVSAFISVFLLFLFVISLFRAVRQPSALSRFAGVYAFLVFSVVAGMLVFLSATVAQERPGWTYVAESRYFALAFVAVQLMVLFLTFYKPLYSSRLSKIARTSVWTLCTIAVLYYPVSKLSSIRNEKHYFLTGDDKAWLSAIDDREYAKALKQLIDESAIDGVRPIYLTADRSSFVAEMMGAEYGGSIMHKPLILKTSRPVVVLIHIGSKGNYGTRHLLQQAVDSLGLEPVLVSGSEKVYCHRLEKSL